jgi:crotonobetainyl-CoA:carnitine CoA-transferase CaiB-like acyl-CoA transferase
MEHPGKERMSTLGCIFKPSDSSRMVKGGAPLLGQDNDSLYKGLLGFSDSEIVRLKREGII